jgi:lipopolysaccharide transport system permease protein
MLQPLAKPFELLYQNRALVAHSVASELRYRTAGTSLGMLWLVLTPALLLAVYTVVYMFIFKVRPGTMSETQYVLYIFCGLVPFLGMSEGITAGIGSLTSHAALLSSTVFPVEILPVRAIFASQVGFAVGLAILVTAAVFLGQPSFWWVLIPVLVTLQLAWLLGIAWILSVVNLVFRDLQNIATFAITLLMVLSPIAYTLEMLPQQLRPIVWLNPLAYYVIAYQQVLVLGNAPSLPHFMTLAISSLLFFVVGFALFSRLRTVATDYV